MDSDLLSRFIPKTYAQQGLQSLQSRDNAVRLLLEQRKLPKTGWDDDTIQYFLQQLSQMDSNNFRERAGVGEREGRVASALLRQRHLGFSHGIGRSGDLLEVQPKAAGSSVLYKLTNQLIADALAIAGLRTPVQCVVFPMATGMTIAMTLLTLRHQYPSRNKVIWSRIDQKSCLKAMLLVGLHVIVVDPVIDSAGCLSTDLSTIEHHLTFSQDILAVVTTTSCFAPRQPDLLEPVAVLCQRFDVAHVVNNAYGVQSHETLKELDRAARKGRIDACKSLLFCQICCFA